jgi:hypothetical protein
MSLYDRAKFGDEVSQIQAQNQVIGPVGTGFLAMFLASVTYLLIWPLTRRAKK